jgi:uncharacterized protein (DUF58 family)
MNHPAAQLRHEAEGLGHALPALLAEAQHLAAALAFGAHGRKRAGMGDEFWQYRPAQAGDPVSAIDGRRSAKSDTPYVRQREWQALNTLSFWVDGAQSMGYSSAETLPSKASRARVLAMALAVMLLRGGERVGIIGGLPPKTGRAHLGSLAAEMLASLGRDDYGQTVQDHGGRAQRLIYLSDFLGPIAPLKQAMMQAADRGARGVLLQVLDRAEEDFPFSGRTVFLSMGGGTKFETQSAGDLRAAYLQRLAQRKDELAQIARSLAWDCTVHHTDQPALGAQ